MIRRLLSLVVVLPLVLVVSDSAGSAAADQTARVKAPKGLKDNMEIAANPNGDVLFVYDSGGKVFAALAKPNGAGKYKGKKAKAISSGGAARRATGDRRPSAVFDVLANEYLVSWDTGPESLRAASAADAVLESSDILSRRLKAKNGKGLKSVIDTVSDGLVNISPLLRRSATHAVELIFSASDPAANRGSSRSFVSSDLIVNELLDGITVTKRELRKLRSRGIISTKEVGEEDAEGNYCLLITVIQGGNATARAAHIPSQGNAVFVATTPAQFPSADTTAAALARLGTGKLIVWKEGGVSWQEARDGDGDLTAGPAPLPDSASRPSNTIRAEDQNRTGRRAGNVFMATQGGDGMAHLLEYDDTGALVSNRVLFAHKDNMSSLRLVALPDGRAMLAWLKGKNKKNDDVWMHVFDL